MDQRLYVDLEDIGGWNGRRNIKIHSNTFEFSPPHLSVPRWVSWSKTSPWRLVRWSVRCGNWMALHPSPNPDSFWTLECSSADSRSWSSALGFPCISPSSVATATNHPPSCPASSCPAGAWREFSETFQLQSSSSCTGNSLFPGRTTVEVRNPRGRTRRRDRCVAPPEPLWRICAPQSTSGRSRRIGVHSHRTCRLLRWWEREIRLDPYLWGWMQSVWGNRPATDSSPVALWWTPWRLRLLKWGERDIGEWLYCL